MSGGTTSGSTAEGRLGCCSLGSVYSTKVPRYSHWWTASRYCCSGQAVCGLARSLRWRCRATRRWPLRQQPGMTLLITSRFREIPSMLVICEVPFHTQCCRCGMLRPSSSELYLFHSVVCDCFLRYGSRHEEVKELKACHRASRGHCSP